MKRNKYDVDEKLEREFDVNQFKSFAKYIFPYKRKILQMLLIIIFSSLVGLSTPLLLKYSIDNIIPNKNIKLLIVISIAFFLLIIINSFVIKYRIKFMSFMGNQIIADMRRDLFTHLQKLSFDFYDNRPHGKIIVRVINYINFLSDLLSKGLINLVTEIFNFILVIIIMFMLNYKLALINIACIPLPIILIILLKKIQRKTVKDLSNKQSNLTAYINESINGIKVTQSFTREKENFDIFNNLMSQYKKAWLDWRIVSNFIWPIVKNISILSQCFMIFITIIFLKDEVSTGVLVAFIGYSGNLWMPIISVSDVYGQLISASSYLERIFETMNIEPTIQNDKNAYTMPTINGDIEFKNVCFGYDSSHMILKNVSFTAKKGQTIALVGATGSGKTTIINLISRFYNLNSGKIIIDGHDISKVTLESLRKQMGIMLQDTFLFSGTIIDNIRYSKLTATDEEVIDIAKKVKAHDFINEMEEGYYTQINERGTRLSTGQRQLISFARVLLANPKILILDEATASIDTQTEQKVQDAMNLILEGRTSLIVAHRLSTIKNADRILVINNGKIVEDGTHIKLLEKKGLYFNLYKAQLKFIS